MSEVITINGAKLIVYNLDSTCEIKFWNEDGSITTIEEKPFGLEKGVFCFRNVNGHPTLIEK